MVELDVFQLKLYIFHMNYALLDPSVTEADKARKGYTPAYARKMIGFAQPHLGVTDVVPAATWSRVQKQKGRLNQQHSEALFHAARAMARVDDVLGADKAVKQAFLTQPNAALDGRVPVELLAESSIGAESVIRVLDSLSAGGPL